MPPRHTTARPKAERECHLHGTTMHVNALSYRKPNGDAVYQWRCMVCRNEVSKVYQDKRRRALKADTRPTLRAEPAPLVEGATRPASQTREPEDASA